MAMKNAMSILEPELHARHEEVLRVGKVVIGTVEGDIHEIGKSLVLRQGGMHG
jgi:methanogenic corrinoid protein MtbC1